MGRQRTVSMGIMDKSAAVLMAVILLCSCAASPARGEASAWAALQEEINQTENGGVITMSQDITALPDDSRLTVPSGKRLTMPLHRAKGGSINTATIKQKTDELKERIVLFDLIIL